MRERGGPRLFVTGDLGGGRAVALTSGQAHYLKNVLRLAPGDAVRLFNGRDGEWSARIAAFARGAASASAEAQRRPQAAEPDVWLLFAPIKRGPLDFLVQKSVELGVSRLQPVVTERTDVSRVNTERLRANVIEAAEQCERLTLPEIREPERLQAVLAGWPSDRRLLVCAERGAARPVGEALSEAAGGADGTRHALLVGPEGGFTTSELDALGKLPFVTPISLGPRILRAETAAVAALACWQSVLGDWRSDRNQRPKAT
jgi:16S rRNA (uracil1498-N3)-methyltransferase